MPLILSHDKLVLLGLLWALVFLGHLVSMGSGMQQGNPGRTCNYCVTGHQPLRGVGPRLHDTQHPVHPQKHDTLLCSIFQAKEPCHRSIPVQLHYCHRCTKYAWVPTGICQDHPRPPSIYCSSDDITLIRQRSLTTIDTTLRLGC
ncbi:hypothetical protein PGT21_008888 [Puccinia graminis f. sp. tritici]|uniref:Uncharacterized protein n=1 Tax=Puccinia graminis f. sp. tritici TaxID=56615 RepID=A0A5B0QT28_PUCGR|nr:hypothetical protein PGT21_008888 [Puccinia graminis f. sp. tritici]